jgi:hypothetical protein
MLTWNGLIASWSAAAPGLDGVGGSVLSAWAEAACHLIATAHTPIEKTIGRVEVLSFMFISL